MKRKYSVKRVAIFSSVLIIIAAGLIAVTASLLPQPGRKASAAKTKSSSTLSSASSAKPVASSETDTSSLPPQDRKDVKPTDRIPVLMYHSINYEKGNILRVPKEKFAAQMDWLYNNGYITLSLDELYDAVSNKKPVPGKSVVLTFDDGYGDNYQDAFPIIKKYHFKATVFMITSKIGDGKDNYLTADQIKEMDANGMHVECHTVTHPDLSKLSYQNQYSELSNSKTALEGLLSRKISFIAYPSGKYNEDTIKAAKEIGYKMCFKMKGGVGSINDNPYEFPRAFVGEDLQDIIKIVQEK